jgi:iron complex transport system permease protein
METNGAIQNKKITARPAVGTVMLTVGAVLLLASLVLAVSVGAAKIDFFTVWRAVLQYDAAREADRIIMSLRLPRELGAAFVGAALAVSSAILQGLTRNPIADPSLLGINAGAAFALACGLAFLPETTYFSIMLLCFLGAGLGAAMVFGLGALRRGGMSPLRITLAGAAVTALLTALAEGIAIYFKLSQGIAFWTAGGVSGTNWLQLRFVVPVVMIGILAALLLGKSLTLLSFGEELAKGLGQRIFFTKAILLLVVLLLAGTAVSMVGSIVFMGLMIAHIVRFFVGTDYRWILPNAAIFGALFMVLADTVARMINPPFETPVGAIVGMIGLPFFLYFMRKGGKQFS